MTEQEKREKAIDEMTKIARDSLCSCECKYCGCTCEYYYACLALYYTGYRKEEEVRKETALEYSNRIDEIVTWCISNKIGDDFDYKYFSNCIRNLKKEFGMDVEE